MTNTYTNAGLIKQEYDTNDSTWGDYENTNKDIQQSLIAGYLQVSLASGNVTLTDVDGDNDQGKNHMFETTGVLSGNTNLIVPTKTRDFKVKNSCTGGFNVTVKTAAGTGIVIPQGTIANLICDGTNIIMGSTFLNGAQFKNSSQTISTVASSGSAQTVDISTANMWDITLTANCTITLSNPSASNTECEVRVRLTQNGTGSWNVTWAGGTILWLGQSDQSTSPTFTTTAGYVSEVVFRTVNGGTTYTAQLEGSGSSSGGGGVSPVAGLYVAVGSGGSVSSSTDGDTWVLQATQFSGADIIGIDQYNGRFHFYGNIASAGTNAIAKYTTNGTTFTSWGSSTSGNIIISETSLCTNGNAIVTNFTKGSGTTTPFSTDNWTTLSDSAVSTNIPTSTPMMSAVNGNEILLLNQTGSSTHWYSTSGGTNFNIVTTGATVVVGALAYLSGLYLIGSQSGLIYYKTSASSTTVTSTGFTLTGGNQVNKFIYTGVKWIAVGNAGKIANAASIGSWTARSTGLSGNIVDIANNGSIVVCVTSAGEVARSADDGDSWAILTSPSNNPFSGSALNFVKYRLTQFWAGGAGGKLGASPDGNTFSLVTSGFGTNTIYDMEAA
jgi:hypothetical protein